MVRLLLAHGADVENATGSYDSPLLAAIHANHLSIVQSLPDAGADVDRTVNETPLSQAAFDGKVEVMEELLEKGVNVGEPKFGSTLLHMHAKDVRMQRFNCYLKTCPARQRQQTSVTMPWKSSQRR